MALLYGRARALNRPFWRFPARSVGVKGTILTVVDDQSLFWEVQASVVFTGFSMPTFILGGRLLTPWLGIAGVKGLDLHDAALYIGLKPVRPPPQGVCSIHALLVRAILAKLDFGRG